MDNLKPYVWIPGTCLAIFFVIEDSIALSLLVLISCFVLQEVDLIKHAKLKNADWGDKEWVLWALKKDPRNYQYADLSLQRDEEIIFFALQKDSYVFGYLPKDLKADEQLIRRIIKKQIFMFNWLIWDKSPLLLDQDFLMYAIENNYAYVAFNHAPENLKKDPLFIAKALESDPEVLLLLDDDLSNNKEVAIRAVAIEGLNIKDLHPDLRGDKDVVLAAIKQDLDAYSFASKSLQYDSQIINAVLYSDEHRNGFHLLPEDLRADKKIATKAVTRNYYNLYYATPKLRKDKDLREIYEIQSNGSKYDEKLRNDWLRDARSFRIIDDRDYK